MKKLNSSRPYNANDQNHAYTIEHSASKSYVRGITRDSVQSGERKSNHKSDLSEPVEIHNHSNKREDVSKVRQKMISILEKG